jgi:D-sedoheptulose 7-phosphate isomerase
LEDEKYFDFLSHILVTQKFNLDGIFSEIMNCIDKGRLIWIMGNGGSASTAEHFETDLLFLRKDKDFPKVRAFSLTTNSSAISAIANDINFESIFSRQLERKAIGGDICIIISASGSSPNLISAARFAKEIGIKTIGLLGFDGGVLNEIVDHRLIVRTEIGKYGPVEDLHLSVCHAISAKIGRELQLRLDDKS